MHRSPADLFAAMAARRGDAPALRHRVDGAWHDVSWRDYLATSRRVARGLIALDVPAGGNVVVIGPNRPEWVLAAWGALIAGAAPAGVYPTLTPDQTAYVVDHAEATVAVVADAVQLAKLRGERARLPRLRHFVLMQGPARAPDELSWADLLARGDTVPDAVLDARLAAIRPDDVATLIYTSGTTGHPKAVMLTHANLCAAGDGFRTALPQIDETDHLLSYLPLSHIAEQLLTVFGPMQWGYTVAFCPRLEELGDHLREVRPTLFFAVPRVWEKFEARMRDAGAQASPLLRRLSAWAKRVGLEANRAKLEGRPPPFTYPLAKRLFAKVHARIGLDRVKICASGAARLAPDTHAYFLSLDLPIYEVYGMSENAALATINVPGAMRPGSVGRPAPGSEVKLAEDGEILVRGAHVFAGYFKDEGATREAIDAEGWLHTGDVGELDADGFLRITDRKKDLFKTSGGKYIAPSHLEGLLGAIPGVAQAVVIGEGRNYVAALVALDPEAAAKAAEARGLPGRTPADLAADPAFVRWIEGEVARINAGLARYETIKRIRVVPDVFSVDTGELTPTLKLKRKVVTQRYATAIAELFAEA